MDLRLFKCKTENHRNGKIEKRNFEFVKRRNGGSTLRVVDVVTFKNSMCCFLLFMEEHDYISVNYKV